MEQYEDDEHTRRRVLSNGQVLAFILGYWKRRPALIAGTAVFTVAAVGVELLVPRAAQALVDAAVAGPAPPRQAPGGLGASSWPSPSPSPFCGTSPAASGTPVRPGP